MTKRLLRQFKYVMTYRYRALVPWVTRGGLRGLLDQRTTEANSAIDQMRHYDSALNKALKEAADERLGRQQLETQRIEEHEALRRLMFGLSTQLGATLGLVDEFITQLPSYTPDQSDRAEVMQGLVEQAK